MKKLNLLFAICMIISGVAGAQNIGIEDIQPKLTSMSNISAFYEMNDITFHEGIINDPTKALEYEGTHKTAANMGVYLADMIYGINTKSMEANESFDAVLELAKKVGVEKQFTQLIIERINSETISASEITKLLDDVMDGSKKQLSKEKKTEYYNFLLYGNYIEKLYLISSVLNESKSSDLPESVKANLNRSLLLLMAKQGKPLKKASKLMVDYSSTIIAHRDIQALLKSYEALATNAPEILKLSPAQVYDHKNITDIQKQVGEIRDRIVK